MRHGFDLGYKIWVHHGEPDLPPPPPVIDNTRQPQMSDMTALLNDLSYISLNNEHNDPTHGDIGDDNKDLDFCPVCNTSRWKDSNTPEKKVPKKVLHYFLIIPRLQRLYKSSYTTKEMIWHATGKCIEPVKMQHLVDGRAWKKFDTKYLDFEKEQRNVRQRLAVDGFNPFGNLSQAYSMWPVILTTYNLPSWLCMKDSSFMLTLLIPSPKSLGKDIDVYLRPLIEDLKTINDFLAQSSLSGWSGQGYKARPTCNKDTPFVRVLSKTAYVSHRRFLKKLHKWRSSLEFNGETNNRDPPKEFSRDEILAPLDRLPTHVKGKHLSYEGVKIKHNVHAILNTLLMNDKSKDTAKERRDLERLGIRSDLWLGQTKNGKCLKPQLRILSHQRTKKSFVSSSKELNYQMGSDHASSTNFDRDDMLKAQIKVVDILYDLELIYSPALFDIMIHLVIHLPLEALEGGPIRPRWMFPFERYIKKPKGYVQNKAKPEGSIAEGYVAEEALTFIIQFNAQELKKVKWYVLHNSEINTYQSQFKSLFPNKDMKEEFPDCRDERRTTQNNNICLPGPDREMYYGRKVIRLVLRNNLTQINTRGETFKNYQYILVTQVKQVFYLEDKAKPHWKVVEHVNHKKFSDEGVIVVEDDPDIIHFENSSDLPLSTSLNDLDNATLHIDGQSTEVDAPPNIIDVFYEDDDIIDDKDALPHDLADSDVEDLINVDDDGVDKMSADVARSHGGNGGVEDRPPPHYVPSGCEGFFANQGKGKRKPNLGPVSIGFKLHDKQTLMPPGEHAAHWSSYIGEVIRGVPLYHPSWLKVSKERKAALIADIVFDLRPHMEPPDWTKIQAGIQHHLQKAYNTNKVTFNAYHWVIDPTTGNYNVEKIRRARPQDITADEWDKVRAQQLKSTRRSLTPSSWHTLLTGNSFGIRTDETRRLEATGTYTDDEINILARGGKQLGHIPGVGRVLPAPTTSSPSTPAHESTLNSLHKKLDFMISLFKSDSKYSDMFSQFESGGGSESYGCKDDEEGADDQDDEDEDGDGDT
nr:hypothetical protein [Tanacetum cinerariifolium]